MWKLARQIAKRLLVAGGILLILLAMAVGAFRLLVTQLPSYQSELKAWVAEELGLAIDFEQLDARWGLGGPELTLHQASLGSDGATQTFFRATRASVSFDPWALVFEHELAIKSLGLDGVRISVERTTDGELRVQGLAVAGIDKGFDLVPSEVEMTVRDGQLLYIDRAGRHSWQFLDVAVDLARAPGSFRVDARARPPVELAERLELSIDARLRDDEETAEAWHAAGALSDVDLGALSVLLPGALDTAGSGDISVWMDWEDGRVARATADVGLTNVAVPPSANAAGVLLDRVDLTAEWSEDEQRSWHLALNDVGLMRDGRRWLSDGNSELVVERAGEGVESVSIRSDYVRLEDLSAIVSRLPESPLTKLWANLEPSGQLSDLDVELERARAEWDYSVAGRFDTVGFRPARGLPGIDGLSGEVRAGARSGTVVLDSAELRFDWPNVFRDSIEARDLRGVVVWREGRDVIRVVSNDLEFGLLDDAPLRSSLELTLPLDGSSPRLDIDSRMSAADLVAAKRLLPVGIMPASVVDWIDGAVHGGTGRNIELDFFGPLAAFPFDGGEGQFRVTADIVDAELEFSSGWPHAVDLNGGIEFRNASFDAHGGGRILGNRSDDVAVGIADLRHAVLTYTGETVGPLDDVISFLKGAPPIAAHLGPGYERLHALAGTGTVSLKLDLPLLDRAAFGLDGELQIADAELAVDGFGPHATEVNGALDIDGTVVTGEGIEAILFDGPVVARVEQASAPGYRAVLKVDGETTVDALFESFSFPFEDLVAGQTAWQGQLMLPTQSGENPLEPVRIDVESNLTGVALHFPEPLSKSPAEPTNLKLGFVFARADELKITGNLGATRRFAIDYGIDANGFAFRRGAVQFGGDEPEFPETAGITVRGRLPFLDFGGWLVLGKTSNVDRAQPLFLGADLELSELWAFGQQLGTSHLIVARLDDAWQIELDSEAIAGNVVVPRPLADGSQIVADMDRVYLGSHGDVEVGDPDPRNLPGVSLRAREFGFGNRRLGQVEAEVTADPLGLRLVSFLSRSDSFTTEGSGSWLRGSSGTTTRFAASVNSTDVATTLEELGLGTVIEGETADLTASVYWSGPPAAAWLDHVSGDVAIRVEKGSLVEIDPGAGRVVGLMSIAALPRRLALDFRDVFNKGFVFDEITGDFTLIDGNAYTNNLKMSGPGAEIGVVGRTGLRDRDYQQQAVVTAEPSNMLPTVGGLLGGPGVGAALFVFTRLFKEPLRGIGRASYCVTGHWDEPQVERLTGDELEQAERCAALPATMLEPGP